MKLINIIDRIIIEQDMSRVPDIELSNEQKREILAITDQYGRYFGKWLLQRVIKQDIKTEDIYKFKDFFMYFEKGKKLGHFTFTDISKYNDRHLVKKFEHEAIISNQKLNKHLDDTSENSDNLISPFQMHTLEKVGIHYMGISSGYQVFKVPKSLKGNEQAYRTYKNILGVCANREKGEAIHICTMTTFEHFNTYLSNDDLYVFFNKKDKLSPYQFDYNSSQFMDKNDHSVI